MSNYLKLTCPKCCRDDDISVAVVIGARLLSDGYYISSDEKLDVWGCTGTQCHFCGYVGEAQEFMPETDETQEPVTRKRGRPKGPEKSNTRKRGRPKKSKHATTSQPHD